MMSVEKQAAETLLEKGVRIGLSAPFFFRLFGKKEVGLVIRPTYLGTLEAVSALYLSLGVDLTNLEQWDIEDIHAFVHKHGKTVRRIIAIAALNGNWSVRLLTKPLASWLKWKLTPAKMLDIAGMVILLSQVDRFTNTIKLFGSMRITSPKNLSPTTTGVNEAKR